MYHVVIGYVSSLANGSGDMVKWRLGRVLGNKPSSHKVIQTLCGLGVRRPRFQPTSTTKDLCDPGQVILHLWILVFSFVKW